MKLTPVSERFVRHWGEVGACWGVDRTMSQIQSLLYLAGRPLAADEIAEALALPRAAVEAAIGELLGWGLVRAMPPSGAPGTCVEASGEVWDLFRLIVEGRRQREIAPTLAALGDMLASPDLGQEPPGARRRIGETREFVALLTVWADELLRQDPKTVLRLLKLGARVSRLVHRDGG